jgi:hypothetical protein
MIRKLGFSRVIGLPLLMFPKCKKNRLGARKTWSKPSQAEEV